MKDLSVIIVNYKGGDRLLRCLLSLDAIRDNRFTFEVIVVDNQSEDGRQAEFIRQFPKFTFVTNSGNNGFANGCNLGVAHSMGLNLLFLNPDTTVTGDPLFNMLEEVRVRPEYSIVSCSQVKDNGNKDRPYGKFLKIHTLTGWLRAISQLFFGNIEDSIEQSKHYIYPDWVSGSVVMIRRSSFFRLGKWDDDYWMYFEDVDLCRRAKLKGGEVVKLKYAEIKHTHGGSSRLNQDITVMTKTEVHISRHLYISKHETEMRGFFMHLVLILNNMLLGLIPASVGIVFFFVRKLNLNTRIYFQLAEHYLNVLKSGKWMSTKSVNYSLQEKDVVSEILPPVVNRFT